MTLKYHYCYLTMSMFSETNWTHICKHRIWLQKNLTIWSLKICILQYIGWIQNCWAYIFCEKTTTLSCTDSHITLSKVRILLFRCVTSSIIIFSLIHLRFTRKYPNIYTMTGRYLYFLRFKNVKATKTYHLFKHVSKIIFR